MKFDTYRISQTSNIRSQAGNHLNDPNLNANFNTTLKLQCAGSVDSNRIYLTQIDMITDETVEHRAQLAVH